MAHSVITPNSMTACVVSLLLKCVDMKYKQDNVLQWFTGITERADTLH